MSSENAEPRTASSSPLRTKTGAGLQLRKEACHQAVSSIVGCESLTDSHCSLPSPANNGVAKSAQTLSQPALCKGPSTLLCVQRFSEAERPPGSCSTTSQMPNELSSEFGYDHRRGACFSTARRLSSHEGARSPGPAFYDTSSVARLSQQAFTREERRTMDGFKIPGLDGPGSGTYLPPAFSNIKGGGFGTASRWSVAKKREAEKSPGPQAYSPKHHVLSTFK